MQRNNKGRDRRTRKTRSRQYQRNLLRRKTPLKKRASKKALEESRWKRTAQELREASGLVDYIENTLNVKQYVTAPHTPKGASPPEFRYRLAGRPHSAGVVLPGEGEGRKEGRKVFAAPMSPVLSKMVRQLEDPRKGILTQGEMDAAVKYAKKLKADIEDEYGLKISRHEDGSLGHMLIATKAKEKALPKKKELRRAPGKLVIPDLETARRLLDHIELDMGIMSHENKEGANISYSGDLFRFYRNVTGEPPPGFRQPEIELLDALGRSGKGLGKPRLLMPGAARKGRTRVEPMPRRLLDSKGNPIKLSAKGTRSRAQTRTPARTQVDYFSQPHILDTDFPGRRYVTFGDRGTHPIILNEARDIRDAVEKRYGVRFMMTEDGRVVHVITDRKKAERLSNFPKFFKID